METLQQFSFLSISLVLLLNTCIYLACWNNLFWAQEFAQLFFPFHILPLISSYQYFSLPLPHYILQHVFIFNCIMYCYFIRLTDLSYSDSAEKAGNPCKFFSPLNDMTINVRHQYTCERSTSSGSSFEKIACAFVVPKVF